MTIESKGAMVMNNEIMELVVHYAGAWVTVLGSTYAVIRSAHWYFGDE
jgi:hypothetical protein